MPAGFPPGVRPVSVNLASGVLFSVLAVNQYWVVRFPAFHVRHREQYVAATLRALLG